MQLTGRWSRVAQRFPGTVAAIGPVAAMVADGVHPGLRATVRSTVSIAQYLLGPRCRPLIDGLPADHYGLPMALTVTPDGPSAS
jgi:hypothetical protein